MKQQHIKRLFLPHHRRSIALLLLLLIFFCCTERHRSNPFDPQNTHALPVSLTLQPEGQRVKLSWTLNMVLSNFRGFRIYRAIDSQKTFQKLIDLPADQFNFTDSSSLYGHWHYYRISLLGNPNESRPSPSQKTYLGPGQYWTLSQFESSIKKVSYDLNYILNSYPVSYAPTGWAMVRGDSLIWLTYNTFYKKAIGYFNKITSKEKTCLRFPESSSPLDPVFDTTAQKLYVLDTTRIKMLTFKKGNLIAETSLDSTARYIKFDVDPLQERLLILSRQRFSIRSASNGTAPARLSFPAGYQGQDMTWIDQKAYILSASKTEQASQLHRVSSDLTIQDHLTLSGFFYRISVDHVNHWIYLAEKKTPGKDIVVKFSNTGSRLFQLTDVTKVEQMTINPYDQSILIIDDNYHAGVVSLFDRQGTLINKVKSSISNRHLDWPIRIFVE